VTSDSERPGKLSCGLLEESRIEEVLWLQTEERPQNLADSEHGVNASPTLMMMMVR